MVLFGESVVFVCWTTSLQDETPVCHDCLVVKWNKQVYNKYIFTARLLGC